MKLRSLKISSSWKNLSGFEVDFTSSRAITVLIGRNGSAKSNLLEALVIIFRNLDLGSHAEFSFEIVYEIHEKTVRLLAEQGKHPTGSVDGDSITAAQARQYWLPRFVVGYYSGLNDRFEKLFQHHDRLALESALRREYRASSSDKLDLNRFICARPIHGRFSLLAYYFSRDEKALAFLREVTRIESFDSVLLVLKKPTWANRTNVGAESFWGATGPVRELLQAFYLNSLAPFTESKRVRIDFKRSEKREYLYLFVPSINSLDAIASKYGDDARALFQALEAMRLSDLVDDLRVRVRVKGHDGLLHSRELSEGEQQLLTVLGLMRFTRHASSLYLLDEPDTHINPAWEMDYLDYLRRIGGVERNSHTLISTHDPLLVAGLRHEQLRILSRSEDGTISAVEPQEHPRGTGVAGVLTSPLYGLPSQLDSFSLRVLKRIYEVSQRKKTKRRDRHLARLRELVPSLQTAETSPDPFRNIARAAYKAAQEEAVTAPNLTPAMRTKIISGLSKQLVSTAKRSK
jgi:predicted ATPase